MAAALRGCSVRVVALAFVVLRLTERGVDGVQTFERRAPPQLEGSSQGDNRANSFFSSSRIRKKHNRKA